jgi:alginate O-acetyltransferase complex protein AlgI
MSFASLKFLQFMLIVYALYVVLPHRWQNLMLLVASYTFYGAWDYRFLSLIALSTVIDYGVGLGLEREKRKAIRFRYLMLSVCVNLGLLAVFKYFNFFAGSFAQLAGSLGVNMSWSTLNIVLPVGISFYTFQTMSYTIDVYLGKLKPTRRFLDFALFVAFFPQLVAGPIERASNLLPRILKPRTIDLDQTSRGMYLILFGLFKKVVVADGLSGCVDSVYGSTASASGWDVLVATWLFAAQIYCDFSAYSDVARGLAKLLGLDLMTNFNLPYFATNVTDFWRRWHISLSTWLRDYLYIPLGGNRGGSELKTYRNLLTTMILGGLWHGAAWHFVLWGTYQGVLLSLHRLVVGRRAPSAHPTAWWPALVWTVRAAVFFQVTCYGWLLFRAESLSQVITFTKKIVLEFWAFELTVPRPALATLAGLVLLVAVDTSQFVTGDPRFYRRWPVPLRGALYAALLFTLVMGMCNEPSQFIYFQF